MITLLAISAFGQEHINKDKESVQDLSETVKATIAKAQRDYLSIQMQVQSVTKTLQDATTSATETCTKLGKIYDGQSIGCIAKPSDTKK